MALDLKSMSEKILPPLPRRLREFIRQELGSNPRHESIIPLLGDASTRSYFRYVSDKKESYILTVYPEPFEPEAFTYLQMHALFSELGLPVPELIALDGTLGIVLQEDLGNETLFNHLKTASPEERKQLIRCAIDYLIRLQQHGMAALQPDYEASCLALDKAKLGQELGFFREHYLEGYRGLSNAGRPALAQEFSTLVTELARSPRLLCHRDYQVRNLMLKQDRLYVIDFQDARMGPSSYDLVSLLKDSIQLEPEELGAQVDYYLAAGHDGDREWFYREFELMSIQRLLKALGTYGYQITVRGKRDTYLLYIRGSLQRVSRSLQAVSEFPYIRSVVERELGAL